jgi:hypothetical protein
MDLHVSNVRSSQRLTGEGGTVLLAELEEIVGALVEAGGGGPDDFQFAERQDRRGLIELAIVLRPAVPLDGGRLVAAVLDELGRRGPGQRLTAELWRRSGSLTVLRAEPRRTSGAKLPALVSGAPE